MLRFSATTALAVVLFFGHAALAEDVPPPVDPVGDLILQLDEADATKVTLAAAKLIDLHRDPASPKKTADRIRSVLRKYLTPERGSKETKHILLKVFVQKQEKAFVEDIVKFACTGDPFFLEPAVNTLKKLEDDSAYDRFLAISRDGKRPVPVRARAILALNHLAAFKAVSALVELRVHGSPVIVAAVQQSLEGILGYPWASNAQSWKAWWEANRTRSEVDILREAIERLHEEVPDLLDPKSVEPNLKGLESGLKSVRVKALHNLTQLRDPASIDALLAYIDREPYAVLRAPAVNALGELAKTEGAIQNGKNIEIAQKLVEALGRETEIALQKVYVEVMGKIGHMEGLNLAKPVIPFLESADAELRTAAAMALGKIDGEESREAVGRLCAMLTDAGEVAEAKRWAANALGEIRDPESVPALVKGLSHADGNVRWSSANALGNIGDGSAVDPLLKAMATEKETRVLEVMAKALRAMRALDAVPDLARLALRKPELTDQLTEAILYITENSGTAILKAAEILADGGNVDAALGVLRAQLSRKPEDTFPFRGAVAHCLAKKGLRLEAADLYIELCSEHPKDDEVFDRLLRVLGQLDDLEARGLRTARCMALLPPRAKALWDGPLRALLGAPKANGASFVKGLVKGWADTKLRDAFFLDLASFVANADGKLASAAHMLLGTWTGRATGPLPETASKEAREKALQEWKAWFAENKGGFPFGKK